MRTCASLRCFVDRLFIYKFVPAHTVAHLVVICATHAQDLLSAFPHSPALATLREALDVSTPHSASPHSHLFPQYASYATHSQGGASDAGSDTDADGQEEEEEEEEWDSWDANWARIVGPLVLKDAAWVSY